MLNIGSVKWLLLKSLHVVFGAKVLENASLSLKKNRVLVQTHKNAYSISCKELGVIELLHRAQNINKMFKNPPFIFQVSPSHVGSSHMSVSIYTVLTCVSLSIATLCPGWF